MKLKYPKISIITPVYNRDKFIEITINSILNQNYPNIEYIVVDDGSTDNSLEIIKKYRKKIIIISQKNKGEAVAVNVGLEKVTGDIIGMVNSDDLLRPGALLKVADFFKDNPDIWVGYPNWQLINEKDKVLGKVDVRAHDYKYMFSKYSCYVGPGAFFKSDALKIVNGRNSRFKYIADFEFWLKLGMYGEFKKIPHTLASFRIHSHSQSQYARGEEMAKEHEKLIDEILASNDFPKRLRKHSREAYSSAYYHSAYSAKDFKLKSKYYLKSFFQHPSTFLEKLGFELKKRLIS